MIEVSLELGNLLAERGFETSSKLFSFLRKLNIQFMYDRTYILDTTQTFVIDLAIQEYQSHYLKVDNAIILLMKSDIKSKQLEVVFLGMVNKNFLLKLVDLKAFS
jgi:hypothetical protein